MSVITFDLTGTASNRLDQIMHVMGDNTPVMQIIGRVMVTRIQLGFRSATSPWGEPWEPLKARNGTPLIDTRRLLSSITYNAGNNFVEIGTNVSYGPYHNFGFTVKVDEHTKEVYFYRDRDGLVGNQFVKKSKSNFAQQVLVKEHEIVVPARPFLPIRENDIVDIPEPWVNASLLAIQNFYESKL